MTAGTAGAIRPKAKVRLGDRVFSSSTIVAGSLILATLAAVALFLIIQSIPALFAHAGELPNNATNFWSWVWPLVFGTI